ncbi:hypothetical protein [Azospirillum sp.]|uniref:hypothetical protein n=1 Tax=Azospirillum sp. TaxID=34012 RepID=UPI002D288C38|nr:hypothetical protein [Azospirillum sp.]HYD70210.1 hypothetical protein [Azospirillum sp.]
MDIKALSSVALSRPAMPMSAREAVPGAEPSAPGGDSGGMPLFLSPVFRYDNTAHVAILAFRDGDTGDVKQQIPPERVVAEYRRNGGKSGLDDGVSADPQLASPSFNAGPVVPGGPSLEADTGTGTGTGETGSGMSGEVQMAAVGTMQTAQGMGQAMAAPAGGFGGGVKSSGGGHTVSLSV